MLIGEGPGENEDASGLPFVGRAGELLDRILGAVELSREQVYLTNLVKCRASVEEGGRVRNRPPQGAEVKACSPYLEAQLETIRPRIILCLGAPAARSIIDPNFKITRDRGKWYETHGAKTMATFHPAYILRQRDEELRQTKLQVWQDIQNVYTEYERALEG